MSFRIASLALVLFLGSQLTWAQAAPDSKDKDSKEKKEVKSLADVSEFCNNPVGAGTFDATRKAAMDKWATAHGFKPITGPCKAKGQWILTWSEAVASRSEAVIERSATGALEVRPKKYPGALLLSRVPADGLSLEPTAQVLYQVSAPTIEEGLDKFVESVEQAKKAAEQQASAEKPAPAEKPVKHQKHGKQRKAGKQVGG